jgi:pimeloyl-ACP methyl ester carboxylesterase
MTLTTDEQLEHLRLAATVSGLEGVEIGLPDEHDVMVGGMRLHYLDWGTEGKPPVVFLHGGCLTAHSWDLVCLALRRDHRCFALDQRGHGQSEWSPGLEYGTAAHVGDLEGFLEHLGLERPVLVGQSLGGINALAYASRHAGELAGLVLVDVAPDVQADGAERILDFVRAPAELDSIEEFVERARAFNATRDPRLLRRSLLHNLRRLPNGRWTWKYDPRGISRERFEAVRAELATLRDRLDTITCKTLVVRGALSDVLSAEGAEAFAGALPDASWSSVAAAGHTVQGDNPRGLAEALRSFLHAARYGVGDGSSHP